MGASVVHPLVSTLPSVKPFLVGMRFWSVVLLLVASLAACLAQVDADDPYQILRAMRDDQVIREFFLEPEMRSIKRGHGPRPLRKSRPRATTTIPSPLTPKMARITPSLTRLPTVLSLFGE
ncbi:unnamed protein product, partial [Mesorhabditis spiculigera]